MLVAKLKRIHGQYSVMDRTMLELKFKQNINHAKKNDIMI